MTRDTSFAIGPTVVPVLFFLLLLTVSSAAAQEEEDCLGFERRTVITGGTNGVESIHIVDVDGDDHLDLVSASFGDNSIYWYENDGGTPPDFTPRLINASLDNASCVYSADLDNDGDTDIIGASRNDDGVFWFEQAAGISPIFSPRAVNLESVLPLSVFSEDVDGDGDMDVLSASFLDNTIAWYENVGGTPPTFERQVITTNARGAASVFAVDVDGDDDVDVLSAARLAEPVAEGAVAEEENWGIAWYEQTLELDEESGEEIIVFTPREVWTTSMGATSVYAADVDGDGDTDVLSATQADHTIAWHESDGATPPTFTARTISTNAMNARAVVVGFVNDDPHLDVLSASYGDDKIAWYRSDGAMPPSFTEAVITTEATHADDVRVGDLDGDGDLDVASASSVPGFPASNDKIRWYENVGPGAAPDFVERPIYFSADGAVSAVSADLDGDGDEDVATAGRTNRIAWYESDGASIPAFVGQDVSLDAEGARDIAAADLDGDTKIDLISASSDDNKIAWYRNDGAADPTFIEDVITTNAENAWDVHVADVDGDMDLDVISAANVAPDPDDVDNIAWYQNNGGSPPVFTEFVVSQNAPGARSVFAADIDGDDDVDLMSASYDDNKIAWYENIPGANPGDPPDFSTEHVVNDSALGASSVVAADIDGDGDLDFLTTEALSVSVAWYENDPESDTYVRSVIASDANEATSAIAHDLDGDGDLDVVATAPGDQAIGWFENLGGDPPVWETRLVTAEADYSLKVAIGNLNADAIPDIVSGSRLSVFWYEGSGEICDLFDADDDGLIDGNELARIGRSFGLSSADPEVWWAGVDYNQDGMIDGEDLAILSSPGVFGFTTETCSYICR